MKYFLMIIVGYLLFSCGNVGFVNKYGKQYTDNNKNTTTPDSSKSGNSDRSSESEQATTPEDITGIYLVCGTINAEQRKDGCAVRNKDGTKYSGEIYSWKVAVKDKKDENKYVVANQQEPKESIWHVSFIIPPMVSQNYEILASFDMNGVKVEKEYLKKATELSSSVMMLTTKAFDVNCMMSCYDAGGYKTMTTCHPFAILSAYEELNDSLKEIEGHESFKENVDDELLNMAKQGVSFFTNTQETIKKFKNSFLASFPESTELWNSSTCPDL